MMDYALPIIMPIAILMILAIPFIVGCLLSKKLHNQGGERTCQCEHCTPERGNGILIVPVDQFSVKLDSLNLTDSVVVKIRERN